MVRLSMRLALSLALVSGVGAYRVNHRVPATCTCSATGTVDGVATGKAGCAKHSGPRYGYICYVENGAECPGAQRSGRLGVYWRPCREDHLREEAENHLRQAMEGIDMQHLQTMIRLARNRGVEQQTLTEAEARVEIVAEMIVARDELLAAIESFSAERLQAALERSEELELDEHLSEEVLEDAVARFQFLEERTAAENAMMDAIQGWDVEDLEDKHEEAARKHVDPDKLHEATQRIQELRRLMAAAREALQAAIAGHDEHVLQAALDEAHRLHAVSPTLTEQARERIDQLSRRYEARDDLQSSIEGVDVETVRATLAIAYDLGVSAETLVAGENRIVELEAQMEAARQALEAAIAGHDEHMVESTLAEAYRLHAASNEQAQRANDRIAQLARRSDARDELRGAIEAFDVEVVRRTLATAVDLGVGQETLTAGENRIGELEAMMEAARQELRAAIRTHDSGAVQASLNNCVNLLAFRDAPELQTEANARLAHLAEEYVARDNLLAAIGQQDARVVRSTLAAARALDVVQPVIGSGEARLSELERMMGEGREALRAAIATHDSSAVQSTLDRALGLFALFDAPDLQAEANARLAHLAQEYVARDALLAAIEGHDLELVGSTLSAARDLDVVAPVIASGERRHGELEAMLQAARETLTGGAETAHANCGKVAAFQSAPELQAECTHLAEQYVARHHLLAAIEGYDVEVVRTTLSVARELEVAQTDLASGENRVSELEAMAEEARGILRDSLNQHRPPVVHAALDQCIASFSGRGHSADNSRFICLIPIIEDLRIQEGADDMMNLQRDLRIARDIGLRQDYIDEGEAAADVLRHKMHDSKMVMVGLTEACNDAPALQAALDEVARLNSASQARRDQALACIAQLQR